MSAATAVRSVVEWAFAAGGLIGFLWLTGAVARPLLGPQAALRTSGAENVVAGVPPSALRVELLMLRDGREIRTGLSHAALEKLLPASARAGEPVRSETSSGARQTQAYRDAARTFLVTCDRQDATGQMFVSAIHLP